MPKRQMFMAVRPYWLENQDDGGDDRRTGGAGDDEPRPTGPTKPAALTGEQWRELREIKAELVALREGTEGDGGESRPEPEYAPVVPYWDAA